MPHPPPPPSSSTSVSHSSFLSSASSVEEEGDVFGDTGRMRKRITCSSLCSPLTFLLLRSHCSIPGSQDPRSRECGRREIYTSRKSYDADLGRRKGKLQAPDYETQARDHLRSDVDDFQPSHGLRRRGEREVTEREQGQENDRGGEAERGTRLGGRAVATSSVSI